MSERLKVTILLRNDSAAVWQEKNPVLSKGEVGIEIDTNKFKIGDGEKNWNSLIYANSKILTADDIPNLPLAKITDAGTAASKNVGTAAGMIPVLDAGGKLPEGVLPAIAITDTFVVASEAEMLALAVQTGDIAVRTDINKSFILQSGSASAIESWVQLRTPDCEIISVNGKIGVIVLTTSDIAEGSNLYFTEARATANFNTNFAAKSVSELSDGNEILRKTDTLIFDCGNS